MAQHTATVVWERGSQPFTDMKYSRVHQWRFDGGLEIRASSSPHVVRVPLSDASAIDPEEALIAALSSCHMLFFLAFAARQGFVVDRYEDQAMGTLSRDENGRASLTRIVLQPAIRYSGSGPDEPTAHRLHHEAHEACYIANSIRSEVIVEPR